MTPRRLRTSVLVALFLGGGGALIATTQTWIAVALRQGVAHDVDVAGSVAAPATAGLALASLALIAAIALTNTTIRRVLGLAGVLLGAGIIASSLPVVVDPVTAAAGSITTATGVAGDESIRTLVLSTTSTAWVVMALACGIVVAVSGLAVTLTAGRWPGASHRYAAAADRSAASRRASDDDTRRRDDAIDDWDTLSRGDDPTERPEDQ